jgi:hypothetical protein
MTPYAEVARVRGDAVAMPAAALGASPRLTIARRPLLDLPLPAPVVAASAAGSAADGSSSAEAASFDLGSTIDVPAFLRRQDSQ